jgi:hypothetical protein
MLQVEVDGNTRLVRFSLVKTGGFAMQLKEQSWLVKMRV